MRSRPEIDVFLTPARPYPGCRMRAQVVLKSRSETPFDGVEVQLRGMERRNTGVIMVDGVAVFQYANATHVDLLGRVPAGVLTAGEHRHEVVFDLPDSAPPAYQSRTTSIEYALTVSVLIPWWPDRVARFLVPVTTAPRPVVRSPYTVCTDARGPESADLYLEASVDSTIVARGGVLTGAVSVANVDRHRVRRVELALVASERAVGSSSAPAEAQRYTVVVHEGSPAEGAPISFRVAVPEEATPTFRGSTTEVLWTVEILAVVAFGADRKLVFPIEMVEPAGAAQPAREATRVPPVGRVRRALVWEDAARRRGFDVDPETEQMSLAWHGSRVTISVETRREGGKAMVGRLSFARLGMGLSVNERRWSDVLARGAVTTGVAAFDERLVVRAREEPQVSALLDRALCEALLRFPRVSLDDAGCEVEGVGAAQSADELDAFAAAVLQLAPLFAARAELVPAPRPMSAHVDAWRAFAALVGGRLRRGDMAIVDGAFAHRPIEIATTWENGAGPTATLIRVGVPERDGGGEEGEPVDGRAKQLADVIAPQVRALRMERAQVEATLPAPLADPRDLLPLLEKLAELAAALGGRAQQGPYR